MNGEPRTPLPHQASPAARKLGWALLATGLILVAEVVGGLVANSLALLSDAGHVFTDALALLLSWIAVKQAERPANARMTYGYHRVGVLVAVFNAGTIMLIALAIFYGAAQRFRHPGPVQGGLMLGIALVGLMVNLGVLLLLRREQHGSLNVRSAFLHALGDALSSAGVVLGGMVILLTGWFWADPIVAAAIGIFIAGAAWRIVKEGTVILLEATPGHLDLKEMAQALGELPGVRDIHDLHVWTVDPRMHVLSCHVATGPLSPEERQSLLERMNRVLRERFDIEHSTIQMDCVSCPEGDIQCTVLLPPRPKEKK